RYAIITVALALWAAYRWRSVLPLLAVASSGLLEAAFFWHLYGSIWPTRVYERLGTNLGWSPARLYQHGLGAILNPSYGWLPFAPVQWLGLCGLPLAWKRWGWPAVAAVVVAVVYICGLGDALYQGYS